MARFFINCVAEEKQFSKFRRTQRESSTMLGLHKYQRYMYSRKHYFIIQSFKLVSLHWWAGIFLRGLSDNWKHQETWNSPIQSWKTALINFCFSLNSPSHLTSMIFHLVFRWPHRGRLSMVNISVSLQFFKWSTGKPDNEIPRVQVCKSNFPRALSFPGSSRVYRQITGFTGLFWA